MSSPFKPAASVGGRGTLPRSIIPFILPEQSIPRHYRSIFIRLAVVIKVKRAIVTHRCMVTGKGYHGSGFQCNPGIVTIHIFFHYITQYLPFVKNSIFYAFFFNKKGGHFLRVFPHTETFIVSPLTLQPLRVLRYPPVWGLGNLPFAVCASFSRFACYVENLVSNCDFAFP